MSFGLNGWLILLFVALTSAVSAADYGAWTSVGCFRDGSPRKLHHIAGGSNNASVNACLDTCETRGFILGGLEFGNECYCGNTIMYDYGAAPQSNCSMPCSGNNGQTCGGVSAMQIYRFGNAAYKTGPPSVVKTYKGWVVGECWKDEAWTTGGPRRLPHWPERTPIPAEQMTVGRCIDGCETSGYNAAGLEYGQECWCSNVSLSNPIGVDLGGCRMPCLGDASQVCGDSLRVLVYAKVV
ncbi:WSC-domain-containing protein [Coprinopsis marcescibilis]|uniref:WSC-domain-containing protein n=1 Tax=Coprinopsis marcescibilis TaxID=230819 RepID=A0A5C3LCJ0_COPMA|nr:WSC-domain-containing protein [Coprinopsis marcescibilis]